MRRATAILQQATLQNSDFYPRSPCGERLIPLLSDCITIPISIHALLAESDVQLVIIKYLTLIFLSTLSLRRATYTGDRASFNSTHFYPRSPCGERRPEYFLAWHCMSISIHALLAESDVQPRKTDAPGLRISIHALLAESDCITTTIICIALRFLSTLSLRRATSQCR